MTEMSKFPKIRARDLFVIWIIATASVCFGTLLNQFRDRPLPLVYQSKEERLKRSASVFTVAEAPNTFRAQSFSETDIPLDEFRVFAEEKRGIILDARPEIFYRLGHVPGAVSLPRDDFEKSYARLKEKLEADWSQPLIAYCSSSSCEDSELVHKALVSLGYKQVAVFRGGWEAWTQAQLPEEKSP